MVDILGILNLSPDSFSDGGEYTDPTRAVDHARALIHDGATVVDIGAVSSNPEGCGLSAEQEITRLRPVVAALHTEGIPVSLDTFSVPVQRWGLAQGVSMLNDIRGFPDAALWPELADASCTLVVMHAVQDGRADRRGTPPKVFEQVLRFFDARLEGLLQAGVSSDRLLVDPGMGFFLGNTPDASIAVLRNLERLRAHTGCELLVSVSRKSFIGSLLGGRAPLERRAGTLSAELFAALHGASWIRTHEPRPLTDALTIWNAIQPTGASTCDS